MLSNCPIGSTLLREI